MASKKPTYQDMNNELEAILLKLQQSDLDIDVAMKNYERGLKLVAELETYLQTAENKISRLSAE